MDTRAASQQALNSFLKRIQDRGHSIKPDQVIARDNIFRVDDKVYLLVRTSRYHEKEQAYFFGLTHHVFENFSQLPNAFIAFLFSDTLDAALIPAQWLWAQHPKLSTNRDQYKLLINNSSYVSLRAKKVRSI